MTEVTILNNKRHFYPFFVHLALFYENDIIADSAFSYNTSGFSLFLGGGVKLPTGKYDNDAIKQGDGMPNMQPGTASFDFMASINYTIQQGKIGLNTEFSYTLTTANKYEYKFGNRLGAGITVFRTMRLKDNNIIPQAGVHYEVSGHDYNNYYWSIKNQESGGHVLFVAAGIQYLLTQAYMQKQKCMAMKSA